MSFKEKYAYRNLIKRTKAQNRKIVLPNPEKLKIIGVVWQPEDIKAFKYLQNYFSKKPTVFRSICVSSEINELHDEGQSISKKDLNWWGIPKGTAFSEFCETPFDVLFNISLQQNMVMDFVTALSQAKFKTGCSLNENNYFDLNIKIGEKQDVTYLAKQQIFYLSQLNQKVNK